MREFKGNKLTSRLQEAQRAKLELLRKASSLPRLDDPAVLAQKAAEAAERQAVRERRAEMKAVALREQAEQEAKAKAEAAVLAEQAQREAALEAEALAAKQKAARDARYAARKNRKP